jgi:ATP-dependent helicase/nuclease subunit A
MNTPAYELNGRHVSREAFYAVACDPRRSVAVEACAGAGKTWMLVSRIVRALLEGAQPQEILAITFTRKAAGEMRHRLDEWLTAFAQATPEKLQQELISRGIDPVPASNGHEALRNLYQTVLESGRPVQIRTFHSWFAALLRTAPLSVLQSLGLPAQYTLLEDDAEAVSQVWRRFHTGVAADAGARADFHALVAVHGRFQAAKALAAALSRRVEFTLADEAGVVDSSVLPFGEQFPEFAGLDQPEDWLRARPAARPLLLAAAQALGRASAPTFSAKGSELEQAVTAGDWPGVLGALLTQKGEPRKFNDKLAGIDAVRAAQAAVQAVEAAGRQHAAWQHQQRMARLVHRLIAEFAALKRERGWVDMNDVERAAQVMLADEVLSGWVQERLDARVRHLLIDEFQDTNPLQWQALHAWLSGYAGSGGGAAAPSVFIVGDPKQSIYRFRRAEPQVFRAAQAFVRDGLGGDLLSCDHTRRNALGVVGAVNRVMDSAQAAGAYAGFRAHTTESTHPGAVLALPQIGRDVADDVDGVSEGDVLHWRDSLTTPRELPEETLRTRECRQAAHWLAGRIAGGLKPKDIMVLARKRDRLAVMQEELRKLHIATQQPEKNDLAEAPEVQDVVALLDVLVSTSNDLALARALKSPLLGCTDDDLVALALLRRQPDNAGVSWFDLLQSPEVPTPALRAAGPDLLRYKAWVDTLPPHDALDAIYHHGDVLARFAAAAPAPLRGVVLANLRALLSTALGLDGGRYLTPYALVRALRKGGIRAPVTADADAVRLLTIHGAKGLEAELVLMLDTDSEPTRADTMSLLVDWPGESPVPRKLVFLASETSPPPCAEATLAAEQMERGREELNALYVAMTRAKTQLVISSVQPFRPATGSAWQRISPLAVPATGVAGPVDDAQAGALAACAPEIAEKQALQPFFMPDLPVPIVDGSKLAMNSGVSNAPAAPTLESRIGQAMHWLLETAALAGAAAAPVADSSSGAGAAADAGAFGDARLAQAARAFELTAAQARGAARLAQTILAGEGAWAWDVASVDWQGNEVTLLHGGETQRIDRLVRRRDTGEWWVLDYKSAHRPEEEPGLVEQMNRYRDAVCKANSGAAVRVAFLTGEGRVVEVGAGILANIFQK